MKQLRNLEVKINYALWAWKRMKQPHLGDVVTYRGEECSLIQGVSNPYWDLLPMTKENLDKPKREIYKRIHSSEFQLDKSFKRNWWAFKSSYQFKMQSWFLNDTYRKKFGDKIYIIG